MNRLIRFGFSKNKRLSELLIANNSDYYYENYKK